MPGWHTWHQQADSTHCVCRSWQLSAPGVVSRAGSLCPSACTQEGRGRIVHLPPDCPQRCGHLGPRLGVGGGARAWLCPGAMLPAQGLRLPRAHICTAWGSLCRRAPCCTGRAGGSLLRGPRCQGTALPQPRLEGLNPSRGNPLPALPSAHLWPWPAGEPPGSCGASTACAALCLPRAAPAGPSARLCAGTSHPPWEPEPALAALTPAAAPPRGSSCP